MSWMAWRLANFLPPLALMGLLFYLSGQENLSTELGIWDLILRKLAHIASYGLLTLLWWRALVPYVPRPLLTAVVIAFLYAISDEYHQSFVKGRSGTPIDVAIDSVGIATVAALIHLRRLPGMNRLV